MKHKVVIIILYDDQHRFLLQHRSKDAWLMPDQWAFFGGEIRKTETPLDAVRREAYEEINYEPKSPYLVLEQDFIEGQLDGYMYVYIENFKDDKSSLKLNEGQGWGWYKESETSQLHLIDRDKKIISTITRYLQESKIAK